MERTLYADGAYDASDIATVPISYDGSPLVVGADTNYGSQTYYDVNFQGALDEFRYYDCVLPDAEVAAIYLE